ncbi:hypothetical protein [Massilia sp. YMA4]|uniref:hypothetical protein n=1 Tax=Massilia sp. YMA4 TaxID=1593482 RepID=UPI000DD180FC|nr:hypothetical protein [Massilia sp. YMA4]AXA92977.1 hypothetical protein DPH57_18570 [Massilia sp. YMA4]
MAEGWAAEGAVLVPNQPEAILIGEVADDVSVEPGWAVASTDTGLTFAVLAATAPTIGSNEFYFLWTVAEQIALEELRQSDTGVKIFMRRLDAPRTTEVVLAASTVRDAVRHAVGVLVKAGVIAAGAAEARIAAIRSGGRP